MTVEVTFLQSQSFWQTDVVAVHARHIFPPALLQTEVHGLDHPSVRPVKDANPAVLGREGTKQIQGPVRGPVIDGDDLEIRPGLSQQTVQACRKPRLGVVAGQHY
jgi:hypothetical protein